MHRRLSISYDCAAGRRVDNPGNARLPHRLEYVQCPTHVVLIVPLRVCNRADDSGVRGEMDYLLDARQRLPDAGPVADISDPEVHIQAIQVFPVACAFVVQNTNSAAKSALPQTNDQVGADKSGTSRDQQVSVRHAYSAACAMKCGSPGACADVQVDMAGILVTSHRAR